MSSFNCPYKMRAWDGANMHTVHSLCFNAGGAIWYGAANRFGWCWVNPDFDGWTLDNPKPGDENMTTLMRWTGFKDSFGADIYEGDIFNSPSNKRAFVRFDSTQGAFVADGYESATESMKSGIIAVIGNVHQHPELLKS